jgi:hypothetical protein
MSLFSKAHSSLAFEDTLLFRIQGRTIFLQDVKEYIPSLKTFHCLYSDSHLMRLSGVSADSLDRILQAHGSRGLDQDRPILMAFMRHFKLQFYANGQGLSMPRGFARRLPLEACGVTGDFDTWNRELRSIVQAELFFRESQNTLDQVLKGMEYEVLF